jgi:branched-chain amino acid transport system ATP-binding protein
MTSAVAAAAETSVLPADSLLSAKGLRKSFGGVHAVRDISFAIEAGAVFAIIGPNGAGKSTLLNLLGGIYQPDAGTIMFGGRDVTKLRPHERARRGIARTFQKIRLFKQLSALENVVAGFHAHHHIPPWQYVIHGPTFRRDQARCREEAARLLSFMGLAQRAHVQAGALPYGEQRMLEIARALATAPRLLMVDEPAAGLNGAEVEMLLDRIAMLRHDGMTLCLVEHNMDLVMKVADRILAINYGQYLAEGSPGEVQSHPGVIEAYLGGALQ